MGSELAASAPATIANLGPGFDIVGAALEEPRDRVEVKLAAEPSIAVQVKGTYASEVPSGEGNVCYVVAQEVLKRAEHRGGLRITLFKEVPPASGLGSSGASSAATAFAVNKALGEPLTSMETLLSALEGERFAAGAPHADNAAPSLLGGVVFIYSYNPLKLLRVDPPQGIHVVIATPLIRWAEKKTYLARQVLPKKISLRKMVKQLGGLVLLVAGITRGDPMLMGEGVNMDFVVEPARAKLIPRFKEVKKAALKAGAYGCSISGAGPSIFALTSPQVSNSVARAMARVLEEFSISYKLLITRFSREGARVEG